MISECESLCEGEWVNVNRLKESEHLGYRVAEQMLPL